MAIDDSNTQEVIPLNRKGATSNVYIVRIDGKEYFMKQLRPELKDDWRYRSAYRKEYEVGHGIDSKYIVKYEVIGEKNYLSLLKIKLHTGRTHQIRVQFASRKHPLVGDRRYGAPKTEHSGIALLSQSLSFTHPNSGERMTFECDMPDTPLWNLFDI